MAAAQEDDFIPCSTGERGEDLDMTDETSVREEPLVTVGIREDRRQRIVLAIVLNLALQIIILQINADNQAALVIATNFINSIQSMRMISGFLMSHFIFSQGRFIRLQGRSVWRLQRSSPFVDRTILASHSQREFKRRLRVNPETFFYICSLVAPAMQKKVQGGGIRLETRVALSLNRLGTGNYLLGCADLFGMSEGLASIVVRDFCNAVISIIRPLVVPRWTAERLRKLSAEFEAKHDIPFIMGAIDVSHIPIIAPKGDPVPFYNRKGFYSVLLQGIVDCKTTFLDWDFGWAGSLHDYTMFVNSVEGRKLMAGYYEPYKLIGDAAYPFRTCMYVPFKGTKENLDPERAHWNFIQSSTRMCVERAFGVLKGRWRILLRRIEMRLDHVAPVVGACICLHNLCVKHSDFIDDQMVEDAKKWLRQQQIHNFGDLQQAGHMRIFDYGSAEVHRSALSVDDLIRQAAAGDDQPNSVVDLTSTSDVAALKAGMTMHRQLAKTLFNRHLQEEVQLPLAFFEEDSSGSDEDPVA